MASFRCRSLHTIYSTNNRTIHYRKDMSSAACYGTSLQNMGNDPTKVFDASYDIMLMTDPNYMEWTGGNNCCLFDPHFIYCYLRRINRVKAFKFNLEESEYKGYKSLKIHLSMKGTRPEFTFVLQSIKRLYEYPYCFYLAEAKRMQEIPEFRFVSIFNLFNAVASYYEGDCGETGHSYSMSCKSVPVRVLKERLPHCKYAHEVYQNKYLYTRHSTNPDSSKWTNENFQSFLPSYIKNLKELSK